MTDSFTHRGPDGEGVKIIDSSGLQVGLGHRRLSIIDLGGGAQPMSNEDDSIWIVYNGEVYNYLTLRERLITLGHRFRTRCDTETIIHAYEAWGADCVDRLHGMFSFTMWNEKENSLFAARDRMGVKPFYYYQSNDVLICSSEIKAIIASGLYSPELNHAAVREFVTFGYVAGQDTLFKDVKRLLPGHRLQWREGRLSIEQYWDIPEPSPSESRRTDQDYVDEYLALLRDSIRCRLMSDVPLGVFLSGGLDSSGIAVTMAAEMNTPVKTFSVGFESEYYSEFDFAREVAASIGAEHHEVVVKPHEAFQSLPQLIWHEDEPIRFPAALPLYEVSRLARDHVRVVLTGEGNDELFAGYERYGATLFNLRWGAYYSRLVPRTLHDRLVRDSLWKWPIPMALKTKLSHSFLNHSFEPEEIIFDNWYAIFPPRCHHRLFASDAWHALREHEAYAGVMPFYRNRAASDELSQLLYVDQKTYLVELLRKQDKMSMAASIESRVPYLDHRLVEFATRVPADHKLRGLSGKLLVKRALRQVLPKSIINRKKMGFPMPLKQWLVGTGSGIIRNLLDSPQARDRNVFDTSFLRRLLAEHTAGQRNHSEGLWLALNFELWARIFLDGEDCRALGDELTDSYRRAG